MHLTEDVLLSYTLNFVPTVTLLLCFKWCRDYVPFTVTIAIASVLSFVIGIKKIDNPYAIELMLAVVKSLLIGLPVSFALEFLPFAGRLADVMRGMQFAEIAFGQNNSRNSILESLFDLMVVVVFFKYDLFLLLLGKYYSLSTVIVSEESLFFSVIQISSAALTQGFHIAMPVIVICISVELISILLAKALPRINLSSELNSAKALLGLAAIYLGIEHYPQRIVLWLQASLSLLPSAS